jgi:DNA-binding NarL/FixJ family response regulator
MRRLRILVADDHELMIEAVRLTLAEAHEDFEIVATTTRGQEVLPLTARHQPDVVLLDLRMPGMDGLSCLQLLRQRHPHIKAVVLSAVEDESVIRAAFGRGAVAFIRKHVEARDLAAALRNAVHGATAQPIFGDAAQHSSVADEVGLSEREISILASLGEGMSNKEIAKQLWLAEQTVKFHLTNLYRKLDVSTRTEAVNAAYRRGLLETPLLTTAI